jgi:chromosome partitioning protein
VATKIIAITNQKGGVGKTTTTVNLSASLGATKRKVLLIDFDPQGNATMGSGVNKEKVNFSAADVLLNLVPVSDAIHKTQVGYDLLPANSQLTSAEIQLLKLNEREYFLQRALAPICEHYDFIFIDCPPALNILTVNALVAAKSVIIPMQCEYYALEGIAALLGTINQLKESVNTELQIEGILRTMYDGRNRLTHDVSGQLIQHFPDKIYDTVIPRNVRLAEAPSHGLPALLYDKSSQGAIAYLALAGEICK